MIIFLFTIFASFVVFLFFYLNHLHAIKKSKTLQISGLNMLKDFRLLLTAIQQHRGLSMGYLNGDEGLSKRVKPLEIQMQQIFANIDVNNKWLKGNITWSGITDHWSRLLANYANYESEYNFRQHCNLVINLLNLIDECAETHQLQTLFSNTKSKTNFLWSQLIITAEHIGQMRGIGTSIASAKQATNLQCIQLNYLLLCVTEFLNNPYHQLDTKLIDGFIETVKQEILAESVNISAEAFYNLATSTIDDLLAKSDDYLNQLLHTSALNKSTEEIKNFLANNCIEYTKQT